MRRFIAQVGWSFTARLVAAVLQLVVVVLLARGLDPERFGAVATANVVMLALVPLNGFGLVRQMQLRRALDRDSPDLPAIHALWLRFVLGSAVLWLAGCLGLWALTDERLFLQLTPIALWLVPEQVTALWNAMSLVDDRARDLLPSYLWRRVPVVAALAAALVVDGSVVWAWSLATAAGAVLAYAFGRHRAPSWARGLVPGRRPAGEVRFDLGFWWTELGGVLRDVDVAAVTLVSAATGGVYALPARLVRPMNLVTTAAASVLYPRLVRARVVSRRQLLAGSVAGTAPVALVAGATALLAGLLPRLVGEAYAGSVPVLRVLCLASVLVGLGTLLVTFCQARSRAASDFTGRAVILAAAVQVPAAGVATAVGDAVGVAWTVTAVTAVACAVLLARALRECGVEREGAGR